MPTTFLWELLQTRFLAKLAPGSNTGVGIRTGIDWLGEIGLQTTNSVILTGGKVDVTHGFCVAFMIQSILAAGLNQ